MKVIPIILTGGAGTRLWPLSRASKPKQFLNFGGDGSLFQQTMLRCNDDTFDACPIIVGSKDNRFLIAEDMRELGVDGDVVLEPVARNSCAAIAAGCKVALRRDENAVVMVLAADHKIEDQHAFSEAAKQALKAVEQGYLITFGVTPNKPATGYGYIKKGTSIDDCDAFEVDEFREKPDTETAGRFLTKGYLWNSGNFLFKATDFLKELRLFNSGLEDAVNVAVEKAYVDLDFLHLDEPSFASAPSISVDYAVMEKTKRAAVFPVDYAWSDLGTWHSIKETSIADDAGNSVHGDVTLINSNGSLVYSEHSLATLVGVKDLIVINTKDALLVCDSAQSESVKDLVEKLKADQRPEASESLKMFRPWGYYERLDVATSYQVKRIVVNPDGVLSLQRHKHRAEHWVVVEGEAEVTIGDQVSILKANQSTYVPQGTIHRLANRTSEPVVMIEVQTGSYLGEDDIERLEDYYNRVSDN